MQDRAPSLEIVEITPQPTQSSRALLYGDGDLFYTVAPGVQVEPPAPILSQRPLPSEIAGQHGRSWASGSAGYVSVQGACVCSRQFVVRGNQVIYTNLALPNYFVDFGKKWLPSISKELITAEVAYSPTPLIVIGHFNEIIYGHFLLEVLPRLLLARRILNSFPELRIAVWAGTRPFVRRIIEWLIPPQNILLYESPVHAERIILPTNCLLNRLNTCVNIFLNDLLCLAESSADAPFSASNRIVIKRPSAHESWRTLVNYDAVIERCERKGFQTVDPASLTFPQQVRLFNQCDLLVSEFNSASHNSIFMPFGSSKVLLNWTNHYESSLAALRHQQMHMVLPRDGEPRLFRNRHQQPAEYEICMEEFESELDRALERSAGGL